jgi:hypothetical protein
MRWTSRDRIYPSDLPDDLKPLFRKLECERLAKHWPPSGATKWLLKFATPPWADRERIESIYRLRNQMQKNSPVKLHVDHIYPLRGKKVCGLHVHENLRVIPAKENIVKGNNDEVS